MDSNVILVFDREKKKLLMCRRRKPPYQGLLNLVGGKVEPGEEREHAAYRELWEETGATGFTLRPVCAYWVQTPDVEESCGKIGRAHV